MSKYLIITNTQLQAEDEDEVVEFLKLKRRDWEHLDAAEFQRLIDTGVATFRAGNGATSVRILQVKDNGVTKEIKKPIGGK